MKVFERKDLSLANMVPIFDGLREGWGLAKTKDFLYATDGTNTLVKGDPKTLKTLEIKKIKHQDGSQASLLNELEYIVDPQDGKEKLWANVFMKDLVYLIDIENNLVERIIDFSLLHDIEKERHSDIGFKRNRY